MHRADDRVKAIRTDANLPEDQGLRNTIRCSSSMRTLDRVEPESHLQNVQQRTPMNEVDVRLQTHFCIGH